MARFTELFKDLQHQILQGRFSDGRRLPSESELALRYKVSRPTAARALRELQNLGVITRRAGSGSYLKPVEKRSASGAKTFGLLVPGLGRTEIMDPICNEITRFAHTLECGVLWGDAARPIASGEDAVAVCEDFVERGVDGVFFAPMEQVADRERWNLLVAAKFAEAGIAVILLDRDIAEFPQRSSFDLVGIDNFRAAFTLGQHLIAQGARRLCFVTRPGFPSTTDLRIAGCREAAGAAGRRAALGTSQIDPEDRAAVRALLKSAQPDAFACANDQTAALLLRTLLSLKVSVPGDVLLAGFDDVSYATLLQVPLTTIRQPCRDLGRVATLQLVQRHADPSLPGRQTLLPHELIVRESTGGARAKTPEA